MPLRIVHYYVNFHIFQILVFTLNKIYAHIGAPCEKYDRLYNDLDCRKYYFCSVQADGSTRWTETPCPDGTIFLKDSTQCVPGDCATCENRVDHFECEGLASTSKIAWRGFPDPFECTKYWWCWITPDGGWKPEKYMCPYNESYSEDYSKCVPGYCVD